MRFRKELRRAVIALVVLFGVGTGTFLALRAKPSVFAALPNGR